MTTLLFLTPELPFPAHSGGKLKSLKLLEHFTEHFEVTLCCPLKNEDSKHLRDFKDNFPGVPVISDSVSVKRSALNLLKSYWRDEPLNVYRTASESLRSRVALVANKFDVAFLDHYEVAQFLPKHFSGTTVYHGHNAYFRLWETYSKVRANPVYKLVTSLEAHRVKRYETRIANRADLVFAAPDDLSALRDAGVTQPTMAETYHLGDYGDLNGPTPSWYQTNENLIYVGYLGWEANSVGLIWFIRHVWPTLLRRHPKLKLKIVGKGADQRLKTAISKYKNIELLGFVEDLDEAFRSSHVCIAPLTFGSGMKVKVLSALSRGIPVVTTPIGAESIAALHREHLMISKTAAEMVYDISELLEDQSTWLRLANKSRELIKSMYTWERLFLVMDAAMSDVLDRSGPGSLTGEAV